MGLETATYINQLVITNPTNLDTKGQGDDHLRLIKTTLKNTFPNITGVVNVTQAQLNKITDETLYCFPGMIAMWSGAIASIPTGWKLCNGSGTISTGAPVPNLRDRFIIGAGNTYAQGATGGSATHTHTVTVDNHVLTEAQIPSHTHASNAGSVTGGAVSPANNAFLKGEQTTGANIDAGRVKATGGGQGHNHGASASTVNHLPPYYAIAFIIKN